MALKPEAVTAIVPCHRAAPAPGLLERLEPHVGEVLVVLDGLAAEAVPELDGAAGVCTLPLETRRGKGHAIAAAIRSLRGSSAPDGVLVVDSDGQHPPEAVPDFVAATDAAELVIGDRFAGGGQIPPVRRAANLTASRIASLTSGTRVPDSQCGMRLLRGRALHEVEFPAGGMESETRHLKRCLRARVPVAWVPIPAIYGGSQSSFRSVRDSVAVLRAALAG